MSAPPNHDQSPAFRRRWLRGAALSLGVHLIGIGVIVFSAAQRGRSGAGHQGVDLSRSAGPEPVLQDDEGVTVDIADDTGALAPLVPSGTLPTVASTGAATATAAAAARPRTGAARSSAARASRVASNQLGALGAAPGTPPAKVDTIDGPDPIEAVDPARAAFRAQLRRHLHQAWHANEVFQRIDPQGRLDGSLFTTAVQVRLRADGTIERATLGESSGIGALDKEALAALGRMQPLPRLPTSMVDAQGGWNVLCKFYLDVGMFRFAAEIRRAIAEKWRPSQAFGAVNELERKTVVRFLLEKDGTLVSANVVSSADIDFLDANALRVVQPGSRLPAPPRAFMRQAGPATVFVAFLHKAGDVRVLKPREDVEDE